MLYEISLLCFNHLQTGAKIGMWYNELEMGLFTFSLSLYWNNSRSHFKKQILSKWESLICKNLVPKYISLLLYTQQFSQTELVNITVERCLL